MTTYILTLSEKQSHTIIIALQEFVSLRNNDWTSISYRNVYEQKPGK